MKKLYCVFLVLVMVSGAFGSAAALAADENIAASATDSESVAKPIATAPPAKNEDTAFIESMPAPISTAPPADDKDTAAVEYMPAPIAAAPSVEEETVAIGAEPADESTVVAIGAEAEENTVAIGAENQSNSTSSGQKDSVPKTGEADYTVFVLPMILFGITGMIVFGKQRRLYESV